MVFLAIILLWTLIFQVGPASEAHAMGNDEYRFINALEKIAIMSEKILAAEQQQTKILQQISRQLERTRN